MTKEEAMKILRETHDSVVFSERVALETMIPELKESEELRAIKIYVKDRIEVTRRMLVEYKSTDYSLTYHLIYDELIKIQDFIKNLKEK